MEQYIVLGIVLVILYIFKYIKFNFIIYSIFTFPATFMHEISHLIISILLNGRPISMKIFPKRIEKEDYVIYELGSVTSSNITWYNSLFIGLSPFLLWICAYFLFVSISGNIYHIENLLKILFIAFLIEGGFPSLSDYKIAFSKSFIFFGILIFLAYFYPEYFITAYNILIEKITYLEELIK